MSKGERIREMQKEINSLKLKLEQANKKIAEYQKRDKPIAGDFIKRR